MTRIAIDHLIEAFDQLTRLQSDLAAIANHGEDDRRQELIALRRRYAAQIGVMNDAAAPVLAEAPPDDQAEYRRVFSAMRTNTAAHQADWPAVRISDDAAAYRASAKRATAANGAFNAWMRAFLTRLTEPNI